MYSVIISLLLGDFNNVFSNTFPDLQLALHGNEPLTTAIDDEIHRIIRSVAMEVEGQILNKELAFVTSPKMEEAFDPRNMCAGANNKITYVGDCNGEMQAGATMRGYTYEQMLKKLNGQERIALGEDIILKSEIIDISVPRAGSPEKHISQEGVITHFTVKDGFRIPGWGYHFYENINLLGEIACKTSASLQKVQKRKERLEIAIDKLCEANAGKMENLLESTMLESGQLQIQGLAGACTYWATALTQADAVTGAIREYMQAELKSHITTLLAGRPLDARNLLDVLSKFNTESITQPLKARVGTISNDILNRIFKDIPTHTISGVNIKLEINNTEVYGFPVVFLNTDSITKLINQIEILSDKRGYLPDKSQNGLYLFKRRVVGGVYYAAVKETAYEADFNKRLLERCIVYSQRRYLQEMILLGEVY